MREARSVFCARPDSTRCHRATSSVRCRPSAPRHRRSYLQRLRIAPLPSLRPQAVAPARPVRDLRVVGMTVQEHEQMTRQRIGTNHRLLRCAQAITQRVFNAGNEVELGHAMPAPLLLPASAVTTNCFACGSPLSPMLNHQRPMVCTAKAEVSWSVPTPTQASSVTMSWTPHGMARSSCLSRKSCTLTLTGSALGSHSQPAFLQAPTHSFFFVSTEITG